MNMNISDAEALRPLVRFNGQTWAWKIVTHQHHVLGPCAGYASEEEATASATRAVEGYTSGALPLNWKPV